MDTQPASHPSHHDQQEQQNQDTDGNTPLHHACLHSAILEIHTLLANGERWNALNGDNKTPAEMTEDGEVRKIMKEEGIRSEMVLRMMMGLDVSSDEEETQEEEEKEEEKEDEDAEVQDISKAINKTQEESAATEKMDTDADTGSQAEHIQERLAPEATGPTVNEEDLLTGCVGASAAAKSDRDGQTEYLKEQVSYDEVTGNLLDNDKNGVMMQWEDLIMQLHAQVICETNGSTAKHKTILNVGFGMGIIDTYIQEHCPRYHYIIEAHPQVYAKMLTDGWDKKGGVKIYFGTWQEVVPKLIAEKVQFDGIFWDTFGETYEVRRSLLFWSPLLIRLY